jgi:hypothetical protein
MSNTHPSGPQGQQPYGHQGQPPFPPQAQPGYGYQQPPVGPHGQAPYGWNGQPLTPQQAAAMARDAKAAAKAQRPWFKKKRFVAPIGVVALFTIIGLSGGGGSQGAGSQPAPAASAAAADTSADEAAEPTKAEEPVKAEKPAKADKAKAAEAPAKAAAKPEADTVAGVGDGVKSGDFKVTITKVRDGGKRVGSEYLNEKAQGHFVLVDVKIKNNGDRADYFSSSDITLIDTKGREFSVNEMASLYVSDNNPLLEEVNPGNTSKGTFVFDLPKGVDAEQAEISAGGLFDGPVTVQLG